MRYMFRVALICVCMGALMGCALMGETVQQRSYVLEAPKVQPVQQPLVAQMWSQPVQVRAAFAGHLFVHRVAGGHYARDHAHVFLTPPGQQLSHVLYHAIKQSGLAKDVSHTGYGLANKAVVLQHQVTEFYVDDRQSGKPVVVMTWHAQLSRMGKHNKREPIQAWTYHQRVLVKNGTAIAAMDAAVAHTVRALLTDVRHALQQPVQ